MNSEAADSQPALPQRRGWLLGAVAAAAAFAGAGVAWQRFRTEAPQPDAADAIWPLAFDTPAGNRLEMESLRGRPLLLNFWATWCPPCIEEMPLLDSFFRENVANGWQVVGLAIDKPDPVRNFLARTPVNFPIGLAASGGQELTRRLGNVAGGLPFTVIVGSKGQVLQRRMGRATTADLTGWRALS